MWRLSVEKFSSKYKKKLQPKRPEQMHIALCKGSEQPINFG